MPVQALLAAGWPIWAVLIALVLINPKTLKYVLIAIVGIILLSMGGSGAIVLLALLFVLYLVNKKN